MCGDGFCVSLLQRVVVSDDEDEGSNGDPASRGTRSTASVRTTRSSSRTGNSASAAPSTSNSNGRALAQKRSHPNEDQHNGKHKRLKPQDRAVDRETGAAKRGGVGAAKSQAADVG